MSEWSDSSLLSECSELESSTTQCVYERDSVVVADGLPSLDKAIFAGTGDGRFTFVLGDQRISSVGTIHADDDIGVNLGWDECVTFSLDIIDLFLSRRTRIRCVGDLYAFGDCSGFYAINERTIVIIEYHEIDQLLRQRLVQIDVEQQAAQCLVYRTYAARFGTFDLWSSVGENIALTVSRDDYRGYIYPANPLSPDVHRDITPIIAQAKRLVRQINIGRGQDAQMKLSCPPFVVTNAALCTFVYRRRILGVVTANYRNAIILDLVNDCVYPQEVIFPCNFPTWIDDMRGRKIYLFQINEREIGLLVRYDDFSIMVGTMNLRTLEWANVTNCSRLAEDAYLVTARAGNHIVVCEMVEGAACSRVIGKRNVDNGVEDVDDELLERFILLRHPLRVESLRRLATIALQKSCQLEMQQLQQIADRFVD